MPEFSNKYSSLRNVDRVVIFITSFDIYSLAINMRYSNKIISMSSFLELYQRKLSINKRDVESILNINPFKKSLFIQTFLFIIYFPLKNIFLSNYRILLFSFVIQKLQATGTLNFFPSKQSREG